jgi:ribosome maturation factor RimP
VDTAESLTAALAPVVQHLGIEIDSVEISKAGGQRALEITLDADAGVDIDTVAAATRAISAWLDDSDAMGSSPYLLEVSSRGVGRPLAKAAHWRRNVGRLVSVSVSGSTTTGRLVAFEDPTASVDVGDAIVPFDITGVERAVVEVEFNRKEDV